MCSWILRTFVSRSPFLMTTLWKALVQPILDYCSQLWCPILPGQIKQLEEVQKCFTRKIKFGEKLDYWQRLRKLKLFSQERRRERYRVMYIWKMFENMTPLIHSEGGGGSMKKHPRNGRTMSLPTFDKKSARAVQKMRASSLIFHGANLFNCLPKAIRNTTNCTFPEFKSKLDLFLSSVPDEPAVVGYTQNRSLNSNSLVSLVKNH